MSTRLPRVLSMLQEVRNSSYLVYFSFLDHKMVWSDVRVPVGRPSPRQGHGAFLGRKGVSA